MTSQSSRSPWSSTTTYLILFSLAQSTLVVGQYFPPQVFRRNIESRINNNTISSRGEEAPKGEFNPNNSASNSNSDSKELWLMSNEDFCIYGLSEENKGKQLHESIDNVVSYCSKSGHDTKLIPDGTLKGVTYVRTPSWVQVSGSGDFTKIGIQAKDTGAQFDSSEHNPQGSKLITSQGGDPAQNWVTMMSAETFCVRACFGDPAFCPTQYDSLGCYFLTSNGVGWDGVYQDCEGDEGDPPGVIDGQTYTPGNGPIPTPSIPAVSNCQAGSGAQNGQTAAPGSENASGSGSASGAGGGRGGGGETTWLPVQTCLPCTATANAGASGSAPSSSGAAGGSSSATSSVPREGGAEGGGEPPAASSAASSALGTNNPFAPSGSASASGSASGSGSAGAGAGGEGGTEQVGVTKLSSSTAASASGASSAGPTAPPADGGAKDLSARNFNWWNNKRGAPEGEGAAGGGAAGGEGATGGEGAAGGGGEGGGETVTKGDQCCFTTWTPSVIGGAGGAKATGASGASKGLAPGAATTGSAGAGGKSAGVSGATHASTGASISGGNGKNGTAPTGKGNGTTTNNESSNALSSISNIWLIDEGGMSKLIGLFVATGLGLICGGMTLA